MPRQSREKSGTGIYQMIIRTVPLIVKILFSGDILRWNDNALEDPLNSGNYVINISHIQTQVLGYDGCYDSGTPRLVFASGFQPSDGHGRIKIIAQTFA